MTINEGLNFKIKATVKLEKYADGVTEEDIKNGLVKPIEVIEYEEDI
jgi:hypothetical protein